VNRSFWRPVAWACARQALLGLTVVAGSLPLLLTLNHALGLQSPPKEGLATLGGSVILGFTGGGLIGGLLTIFGSTTGFNVSSRKARFLAALAGLVWGFTLCTLALPLYVDDIIDDVTDTGTTAAISHADTFLDHPTDALNQVGTIFGELAQEGSVRLPALVLLGWTLLGPALAAPIESRPPEAKR
jgi:hypothetical protein